MSGIFKAVKKTIKKVGKVIKKIGPTLLIAAAVYFGGAYLMSSGAASAGAAGSVGTSFTKAGGVWKAFLSGMGNGTASQSAAAYAEASYQVSIGDNALPLSGQVAAGTAAVNALSNMGGTADAVAAGTKLARDAAIQSGGNVHEATNIVMDALSSTQNTLEKAAIENVSPADALTRVKKAAWGGATADSNSISLMMEDDAPGGGAGVDGIIGQSGYDARRSGASITQQAVQDYSAGRDMFASAGEQKVLNLAPTTTELTPGGQVQTTGPSIAQTMAQQQADMMALWRQGLDDSRAYNQQILADRNKIAQQQMWLQGTGMLLSALGAEEPLEVTKDKRKMAWKPSGKEEYASGAGKIYPGGIIS